MSKVKFNLKNKKHDETLIFLIYRYNGKRVKLSTGIKIKVAHWNENKQSIREVKGYYEYSGYNTDLIKFEQATQNAHSFFKIRDEIPSVIQMKEKILEFKEKRSASESILPKTVVSFVKKYIDDSNNVGKKRGTVQGFEQLLKVLEKMPNGISLEFKDLNEHRLNEMVKLMVDEFDYRTSQIDKIQRKLITIVNQASTTGQYELNPAFTTRSKSWRVKLNSSDISGEGIAFTPSELSKIEKVDLCERLDRVRDRFIIGVNVGQRFSTFNRLNIENVILIDGVKHWDFIQPKTRTRLKLQINDKCLRILDKYNGYPPTISMTNFNKYLKEVCEQAEINNVQIVRKSNPIEGVVSERRVPKYKLASSHDCRRTLATILHNNGVSLMKIKSITGHKRVKDLELYLKIDSSTPISEVVNLY